MHKKLPPIKNIDVESSSTAMEELTGTVAQLSVMITQVQATLERMETRLAANLENIWCADYH